MSVVPGRYMRVGEKKGPLVIGGALKKFEEDSTFMYLPAYHVAGTEKDIKSWLQEKKETDKLDEKFVKESLKSAYTKATLEKKNVREAFEKEVNDVEEARSAKALNKSEMQQVDLNVLVLLLKQYKEQRKNNPASVRVVNVKSNSDLKSKMSSLKEGKVIDVTSMKRKGTDKKVVTFKEENMRRLSQQKEDAFYSVVYDPTSKSSSIGVRNFLLNYGSFDSKKVDNIVKSVKDGEMLNINKVKSPTRSPLLSPRRNKKTQDEVDDFLDDL